MNKNETVLTVGSITYATKAKKLLEANGITAHVVKSTERARGCSYGIRFDSQYMIDVAGLLRSVGIRYTATETGA